MLNAVKTQHHQQAMHTHPLHKVKQGEHPGFYVADGPQTHETVRAMLQSAKDRKRQREVGPLSVFVNPFYKTTLWQGAAVEEVEVEERQSRFQTPQRGVCLRVPRSQYEYEPPCNTVGWRWLSAGLGTQCE
jgi:hypothetical protein